jgi:hypothetical protein
MERKMLLNPMIQAAMEGQRAGQIAKKGRKAKMSHGETFTLANVLKTTERRAILISSRAQALAAVPKKKTFPRGGPLRDGPYLLLAGRIGVMTAPRGGQL